MKITDKQEWRIPLAQRWKKIGDQKMTSGDVCILHGNCLRWIY